uniref:Gl1 n=1 Tax=Arundo donax TaxID=35708 RepID=A0A0A9FEY5_ARUDO
MTRTCLLQR